MTTLAITKSRVPALTKAFAWVQGPVAFPLLVFIAARLINAVMILLASRQQIALDFSTMSGVFIFDPKPADPGYWKVITNWDGQWYQMIATDGYQQPTAVDTDSGSRAWAWAFPPLYPLLVGLVMTVSSMSFAVAASTVSLAAGAAGHILLYRYLVQAGGTSTARAGVVLTSAFISAPLFQIAYSEGLAFLLLMASLCLIQRRSYWWCLVPVTALSFTRLVTPALLAVVLVHVVTRARSEGWSSIPAQAKVGSALLGLWSVAGTLAWPTLASHLMGAAGRFNRASGTVKGLNFGWFTQIGEAFGLGAILLMPLLLLLLVVAARDRRHSIWGVEMRTWSVVYPLYILLLTPLGSGVIRYALLAPSLGLLLVWANASRRSRLLAIAGGVALGLLSQWWYIANAVVVSSTTPLMVV